jgi:polysaccharide deacetylase 2 family uncharacterized protein YibQ
MLKLATRRPTKRSRPPGDPKRKARRKTPSGGAKSVAGRRQRQHSILVWLSGKVVTTILLALVVGVGLGIVLGHWLDPDDPSPVANVALEISIQTPLVPRSTPKRHIPVRAAPEPAPQTTAPAETTESAANIPTTVIPEASVPVADPKAIETRSIASPEITTKKQWLANAVMAPSSNGKPIIALVIDDVGVDLKRSRRAVALKAPLTIAIMTYANDLAALASTARLNGHELIVHVPMEPVDLSADAGPNVLLTSLETSELMRRLVWALTRFDGYVGISNHMGSRFTAWEPGMQTVLAEVQKRGLLYLDSRTTSDSAAGQVAHALGLPYAARDVFLDNDPTPDAVRRQIAELEQVARRHGYAVGIGHPRDATIEVLGEWLQHAEERGFVLVPISAIVRRRLEKN